MARSRSMVRRSSAGVRLRDQAVHGDLEERGVAEPFRSIGEDATGRLRHEVDGRRGVVAGVREREALENVQRLDECNAARAHRRHRDDVVAAIGAVQWLAFDGFVGRQIALANESARALHFGVDEIGDGPAIETVGSVLGDQPQRARQIRLLETVALDVRRAVAREDPHRLRKAREQRLGVLVRQRALERRAHLEPVGSEPNRRNDDVTESELPVLALRICEAGNRPWHTGRERADAAEVGDGFAVGPQEHVARRECGRHFAVVDRRRAAVGESNHHQAATAQVAGLRMRHGQGEPDGDRGVDGVAALPEDVEPGLARVNRRRTDDGMPGANRRSGRRLGVRCEEECGGQ